MCYCQGPPLSIFLATVNIFNEVKSVNVERHQILWNEHLHLCRRLSTAVFFVHYEVLHVHVSTHVSIKIFSRVGVVITNQSIFLKTNSAFHPVMKLYM